MLVGDSHGLDVMPSQVQLGQSLADHFTGVVPNFHRVVLDPAGPGEDQLVLVLVLVLVLELTDRDHRACFVEDDRSGTRGSLVDCDDVLGLEIPPWIARIGA